LQDGGVVECSAYVKFCLFSIVPLVNWAQITDYTAVDFAVGSAGWAEFVFPCCVAMGWADAKSWRQGEVG
jgi:hypothetical protein